MPDRLSDEVPGLWVSDLEHLRGSAISVEVIRERGYTTALKGSPELVKAGFSQRQRRTGILIPLWAPDGSPAGCQLRPARPRVSKDGKSVKYETPAGSTLRLDMPPRCRAAAKDIATPLYITEGAKKADALASAGLCAVNLSGVWGFKARQQGGGTVWLADWDYIALQGRDCYPVFDSDIVDKPQVRRALERLTEHLQRHDATVHILQLPPGPDGAKVGVDDWLAAGNRPQDLAALERPLEPEDDIALENTHYRIYENRFCVIRNRQGVRVMVPLCNFTAHIRDEVTVDDGIEPRKAFEIAGSQDGKPLPTIQVPADKFASMNWITERWGGRTIIFAGSSTKDHLRTIIQISSRLNGTGRMIYTHSGWRQVGDKHAFLSASGALGASGVEVALPDALARYNLPLSLEGVDLAAAIRASIRYLQVGALDVTGSLWAGMFLAPLSALLDEAGCEPAFALWINGHTGSFKSVLAALALCHFGEFVFTNLPSSWRDTPNRLEWTASMCKDMPLVIDDWHPVASAQGQRDMEFKAELVIRGAGNRAGRGRLQSDTSPRQKYQPRGLIISTGEHLPYGESSASRLWVANAERYQVDLAVLTAAQAESDMYRSVMAGYLLWLSDRWDETVEYLRAQFPSWRQAAMADPAHLRLPAAVAWLYAGVDRAAAYFEHVGAITADEASDLRDSLWATFVTLGAAQSGRVEDERPALRFLELLRDLYQQGRLVLLPREQSHPVDLRTGQEFVGWIDDNHIYLLPVAAYTAAYQHSNRSGHILAFKDKAVWADLARLRLIPAVKGGRYTQVIWVGSSHGVSRRVLTLQRSALENSE